MNFISFNYANFTYFSTDNSNLNMATNFNVVYTQIDNFSFKLKLSPILPIYFVNSNFCANTQVSTSTTLQYSQYLYKISSLAYAKQVCLLWSILPV